MLDRLNRDVKIAFFDLDKTLTDVDTDWLWATWRARRSWVGVREVLRLIFLNRDYRKGRLDINRYMKYHRLRVSSTNPEELRDLASQFFSECGKKIILNEAKNILNFFKEKDIPVVIITAQNNIVAGPFARYLEVDHLIGNSFNEEGNEFSGHVTPYSFQEGKVELAAAYAGERGVALEDCTFFSDSIHDEPLLSSVGYPVVINPDSLLGKKAERESWPVIHLTN